MSGPGNLDRRDRGPVFRGPPGGGPMGGGPMMMGMGGGEKARDFRGTMKSLVKYLRPYRVSIIVVLVFATASTAFAIFGPKILGKATTRLFDGVLAKVAQIP